MGAILSKGSSGHDAPSGLVSFIGYSAGPYNIATFSQIVGPLSRENIGEKVPFERRRPPGTISRFCGWRRVWLFRGDGVEFPGALFVEDRAFGFVAAAPVFVAAGDEEVFAGADALFAGVILI